MAYQRSEVWVSPFAEMGNNIEALEKAMETYKEENRRNARSRIDYEQKIDEKDYKLHQSMFSKQHGCILDYCHLPLLARKMDLEDESFTDYDKALNDKMLTIWLSYVKENDNV